LTARLERRAALTDTTTDDSAPRASSIVEVPATISFEAPVDIPDASDYVATYAYDDLLAWAFAGVALPSSASSFVEGPYQTHLISAASTCALLPAAPPDPVTTADVLAFLLSTEAATADAISATLPPAHREVA